VLWLEHRLSLSVGDAPAARDTAFALEILRCEDLHDTRHRFGGRDVDRAYLAMRHLAADEPCVGLAAHINVVGVVSRSCQKAQILATLGSGADTVILRHSFLPEL
jgi:hypothetical protein